MNVQIHHTQMLLYIETKLYKLLLYLVCVCVCVCVCAIYMAFYVCHLMTRCSTQRSNYIGPCYMILAICTMCRNYCMFGNFRGYKLSQKEDQNSGFRNFHGFNFHSQ